MIEADLESNSLEDYFLAHIKDSLDDEEEYKRLSQKAKELFSAYEEGEV